MDSCVNRKGIGMSTSGRYTYPFFAFRKEVATMNENEGLSEVNENTTSIDGNTDQVKVEDQKGTEQTGGENPPSPEAETGTTDITGTVPSTNSIDSSQVIVTAPIDPREQTIMTTGDGAIVVIHEVTLGDVVVSTLIAALLVFMVLEKVIRR